MKGISLLMVLALSYPALGFAKDSSRKHKKESLPAALDILQTAMAPTAPSYEGRVRVDAKEMKVHFEPPNRYRREILNETGRAVQVVISDGKTEWIYDKPHHKVWQGEPADPGAKKMRPDEEYGLLKANYEVVISSSERVARREVWLLSLRSRFDGALKRLLWVDQKTGLILKSESFASDGTTASAMEFETVTFPKKEQAAHFFEFVPPRTAIFVKRAELDFKSLDQAKSAGGMEPRTPSWLPTGFVFESLDVMPRRGKNIIHYRYSDGVSVLSLFQCPPKITLDFGASQTRPVRLASGTAALARTRDGNVLGWSSGGSQFVLVGPVGADALERVAQSIR